MPEDELHESEANDFSAGQQAENGGVIGGAYETPQTQPPEEQGAASDAVAETPAIEGTEPAATEQTFAGHVETSADGSPVAAYPGLDQASTTPSVTEQVADTGIVGSTPESDATEAPMDLPEVPTSTGVPAFPETPVQDPAEQQDESAAIQVSEPTTGEEQHDDLSQQ